MQRYGIRGGYHVIECKDRDEAVELAWRIPTLAAGGVVEVQPCDVGGMTGAGVFAQEWTKSS